MVLRLKARESRSPPGPPTTPHTIHVTTTPFPTAGWSSPVARQAHNLKVAGSNPAPATTFTELPEQDANASGRAPAAQGQHRRQIAPSTTRSTNPSPGRHHDPGRSSRARASSAASRIRGSCSDVAQLRHLLPVELRQVRVQPHGRRLGLPPVPPATSRARPPAPAAGRAGPACAGPRRWRRTAPQLALELRQPLRLLRPPARALRHGSAVHLRGELGHERGYRPGSSSRSRSRSRIRSSTSARRRPVRWPQVPSLRALAQAR